MHTSCTDCVLETVHERQSWVEMRPGGFEGCGVGGASSSRMRLWAAAAVHILRSQHVGDKVEKIMETKMEMFVFFFTET